MAPQSRPEELLQKIKRLEERGRELEEEIRRQESDLRSLRQSEEELKRWNIIHTALFEVAPDGILVVGENGNIVSLNRRMYGMWELPEEPGAGIPAERIFQHIRDRISTPRESRENLEKLLKSADEKERLEIRTVNGRTIDCHSASIRGSEGGQYGRVIYFRDLSEQRDSEAKYRSFMQSFEGIVFRGGLDFVPFFFDGAVERITGYREEDFLAGNPTWDKIIHPDDLKSLPGAGKLSTEPHFQIDREYRIVRRDGEHRWIREYVQNVCDSADRPIAVQGTLYDVTESKKMREEMLRIQKLESIGVLAGGIAHDFNNLLTSILGNISLAKLYSEPDNRVHDVLSEAEKASERARDLTRQLLTFSRGGTPVKKGTEIQKLVRDSVDFALRGTKVKSEFQIAEDVHTVSGDAGQLYQVFHNLAINAEQAMRQGGLLRVSVTNVKIDKSGVLPLEPGDYVLITFQDQGEGIPPKHLPRIFEPYFSTKKTGSGLGLAIVYSIVRKHEGTISVESQVGEGATFMVYLPAGGKAIAAEKKVEGQPSRGAGRILVMDDEESVRNVAGALLNHLGYQVEVAADGLEALHRYESAKKSGRSFDAVIMDLTVPGGMGGTEAVAHLIEFDPDARVIVSSGYANDPILAAYQDYGFSGVIAKPYQVAELAAVLKKVLKSKT